MGQKTKFVNVTHDEWLRLFASAKERSFSVDERHHEWILREAAQYGKEIYTIKNSKYYLIIYA